MADATLDWQTFSLNGNYEVLGSDAGVFAFQTPLATLHKFQGWADLFLTTPSAGVRDLNFTLTKKFPAIPVLPRSEEHPSELQSLMRTSYAVFCLKNNHNNS